VTRALRDLTRRPTLRLLDAFSRRVEISRSHAAHQLRRDEPGGGGKTDHPVVKRGAEFLKRSHPLMEVAIDTNLATWVTRFVTRMCHSTTRSAKRFWGGCSASSIELCIPTRWPRRRLGLDGLPGGVPDADDTAGAILALH